MSAPAPVPARVYESVSSIELARNCPRAYWYRYRRGMRSVDIPWADIESGRVKATTKQRSTSLGKAGHAVLEDWHLHRQPDWESFPGQIVLAGAYLIPHPDRVFQSFPEISIGDTPIDHPEHSHAYEAYGALIVGYEDLLVEGPAELHKLGINAPDNWAFLDYKTSGDPEKWAKTAAELERDLQANVYTHYDCELLGLDGIPGRWVYFATKGRRRAHAVDVGLTYSRATDIVEQAAKDAIALRELPDDINAFPMNVRHCPAYGGCEFHEKQGGPCKAKRSIGALVQARVRRKADTGDNDMSKLEELKARFQAGKSAGKAAMKEAEEAADEAEEQEEEEEEVEEQPEPVKRKPGRPAGKPATKPVTTKPATKPAAAAKSGGSLVASVTITGSPEDLQNLLEIINEVAGG